MKLIRKVSAMLVATALLLSCASSFAQELSVEVPAEVTAPVADEPAPVEEAPAAEPVEEEPATEPVEEESPVTPVVEEIAVETPVEEEATDEEATEEEPTEEEIPEEEPVEEAVVEEPLMEEVNTIVEMDVTTRILGTGVAFFGETVTMEGDLTVLEGLTYTLQWQQNDGEGWYDIEGANDVSYSFVFTEDLANSLWRLVARVETVELQPVAAPEVPAEVPAETPAEVPAEIPAE